MADRIIVHGAKVHNLRNIDVEIPLNKIVGIAGVSGSGKSSLALGVLYAEGSRRYLESLSTYTRRRMTQAERAWVDDVLYIPAALALRQRPGVPGIRSTFGTGSELLNSLRLMFSRLASHRCPNGHYIPPTLDVAAGNELKCPICGATFFAPSAEELAFNSQGACPKCNGTGIVHTVDKSTLVPDETLTIDQGAVAPWNSLMWSLMVDVCREMGVRTNIPFKDLTDKEKDIVYNGPAVKKHIFYKAKNSNQAGELDFTYYNAVYTVENALSKVKDEQGMKRVEKFLKEDICPDCHGSRLSQRAREPKLCGISLDEACTMTLSEIKEWVKNVPSTLPSDMKPMAERITESFLDTAKRLMDLGLGYLSLDRAAGTLSTGERQRMQLARAVRNRTTGVLYVLDEPSIGLHPSNIDGLKNVMHDLVSDGNSVVLVDHDTQILSEADWIIEMGPGAGENGGNVIAEGDVKDIIDNSISKIGPFLSNKNMIIRQRCNYDHLFDNGCIEIATNEIHTVKPLDAKIPKGRLTVITTKCAQDPRKVDAFLEMLDAYYSDPEYAKLANYGLEGIHFESTEYGNVRLMEGTELRKEGVLQVDFGSTSYFAENVDTVKTAFGREVTGNGYWRYNVPACNEFSNVIATLDTLTEQAYFDIITGAKPVDYFDTFVEQFKAAGGETAEQAVQALQAERTAE